MIYKASANPANMPPRASTSALPSANLAKPQAPPVAPIVDKQSFPDQERFEKAARKFARSCGVELAIFQTGTPKKPYMRLCCDHGGKKGWQDPDKRCTWQICAALHTGRDVWFVLPSFFFGQHLF